MHMRAARLFPTLRSALPLSAILVFAACSDDVGITKVVAGVEVVDAYDFGAVQVGLVAKVDLDLTNVGQGAIAVTRVSLGSDASGADYEFKVRATPKTLGTREGLKLSLTFQPLRASATPYETTLTVETDGKDANGNAVRGVVRLKGLGVEQGLKVTPNPVDFGTILAGQTATIAIAITNLLTTPTELRTALASGGRPDVQQVDGDGTFEIEARPTTEGSLLAPGQLLQPNETITVVARYRAPLRVNGRPDRARWTISNCADPLCELRIELVGRATANALVCMPSPLDFAGVNPGRPITKKISCANVASAPIEVTGWSFASGSAPEYTAPAFGASGVGTLAAMQTFDVDVTFAPTVANLNQTPPPSARLVVTARNPSGLALDPVEVPITGRAGGPTINVVPNPVTFGTYALGTSTTRRILVSNEGYEDLVVTRIDPDTLGTGAFTIFPATATLRPGESTTLEVTFAPVMAGMITSAASFVSNDPSGDYAVPLLGIGLDLPPCLFTIAPSQLNFGVHFAGTRATLPVVLENAAAHECLVNDVVILPSATATTTFTLARGPETGLILPGGGTLEIPVVFAPPTPGSFNADLRFAISDPNAPIVTVPLAGTGDAATQIACPATITTPARTGVTLTASPMFLGTTRQSVEWRLVGAPMGGMGTPNLWNPDPPVTDTVTFTPVIVGTYDIEVVATDTTGGTATCRTTVIAEGRGLRVTMTWDGAGDVDLHMHNQNVATPWFSSDDCYYSNRQPIWDATYIAGVGTNPTLDFDNTSANGPENISLDTVVVGVPYMIAAHNFSRSAGRIVDIQIFCGQATTPIQTFTSRPLAGTDSGNCTPNDFWRVAVVTFSSQSSCTITPIDTYLPSSNACVAY